jgi:IS1 family transposase
MRAVASAPPDDSSASIATPSCDSPVPPVNTPTTLMRSSWLFPPRTREVQFDEKWSFVAKKQKSCDPTDPADDHKGDWWDHVAYDPEHRLVLAVVPGARSMENAEEIVAAAKGRTAGATPRLMTSDEYPAYATAIAAAFGVPVPIPPSRPGRRPILPERRLPAGLTYATVHKEREEDRVVAVERRLVFGTEGGLEAALAASVVSRAVNTSFVERQHGTDRGRNARKARKTYRFSKDWRVHEAMSYFTLYRYNFGWVVRTLRHRDEHGRWQRRTPAMAAGLSDHVWSLREWVTFPAVQVA